MTELTEEQIEEVYQRLPEDLKNALFSEINALFIRQTAAKFKLPPEKIPNMADAVGLVMMGLLPPQNLDDEIKNTLNIDGQKSRAIAEEINFKVFSPIRIRLRKLYGLATPEELSLERIRPATMPPTAAPFARPQSIPPSFAKATEGKPSPPPLVVPAPISARPPIPVPPTIKPPITSFPRPIPPALSPIARPSPPSFVPRSGTTEGKPAPISARPPIPAPPTVKPPITSFPRPVPPSPPPVPKPFVPPWQRTQEPGVIFPKTITPSSITQRPAYESPALSPKPISPLSRPVSPSGGAPTEKPITPSFVPQGGTTEGKPPLTGTKPESTISPGPEITPPSEPIDLTKVNLNDPNLKGNIVDLKNLE
ncbi:MAG: hypothetical protein Q8L57_01730 [bacterium]|nr:hypothetical protein [bacterium]